MIAGGKQVEGVRVVNNTSHELSDNDISVIQKKAPEGTTEMIVDEPKHREAKSRYGDDGYHALALKYVDDRGTFVYCTAAGSDFPAVLELLQGCKKQ